MEGITLKQIAKWCGGTVEPEFEQVRVKGFTKDSRQLAPGNMYVAIQGARVDGHDFVKQVQENGAGCRYWWKNGRNPAFRQCWSRTPRRHWAALHQAIGPPCMRRCWPPPGSVGKDNHQGDAGGDLSKSHVTG